MLETTEIMKEVCISQYLSIHALLSCRSTTEEYVMYDEDGDVVYSDGEEGDNVMYEEEEKVKKVRQRRRCIGLCYYYKKRGLENPLADTYE
jgi:hypothetical protein